MTVARLARIDEVIVVVMSRLHLQDNTSKIRVGATFGVASPGDFPLVLESDLPFT